MSPLFPHQGVRTEPGSRSRAPWIGAASFYAVLALLYLWPMPLGLFHRTPFLGLNYAALANGPLMLERLVTGSDPLVVDRVLYPTGYTVHEGFLPSLFLYLLGGSKAPALACNLALLFTYVAAGLSTFWLTFALTGSRPGSFLAGTYFAFSHLHFSHLGVYPMRHIEALPLFAACCLHGFRSRSRRSAVAVGAALWIACLCSWYLGVFCSIVLSLITVTQIKRDNLRQALRIYFAVALAVAALYPFSPHRLLGDDGLATGGPRFFVENGANGLSLLLPSHHHRWFGESISALQDGWLGVRSIRANYLGTGSLALGLFGIFTTVRRTPRTAILTVGLLIIGVILALGPVLVIGDGAAHWKPDQTLFPEGLKLPYLYLLDIFPFSATRATARYTLLAQLALAIGISQAFAWISHRTTRRRGAVLFLATLGVLAIELDVRRPAPRRPVTDHPTLSALAAHPSATVLDLPWSAGYYRAVSEAAQHPHRVLGGAIDKPFAGFRRSMLQLPYLAELLVEGPHSLAPGISHGNASDALDALAVSHALLHTRDRTAETFGTELGPWPRSEGMATYLLEEFHEVTQPTAEAGVRLFERTPATRWVFPRLNEDWGWPHADGGRAYRWVQNCSGVFDVVSSTDQRVWLRIATQPAPHRVLRHHGESEASFLPVAESSGRRSPARFVTGSSSPSTPAPSTWGPIDLPPGATTFTLEPNSQSSPEERTNCTGFRVELLEVENINEVAIDAG